MAFTCGGGGTYPSGSGSLSESLLRRSTVMTGPTVLVLGFVGCTEALEEEEVEGFLNILANDTAAPDDDESAFDSSSTDADVSAGPGSVLDSPMAGKWKSDSILILAPGNLPISLFSST